MDQEVVFNEEFASEGYATLNRQRKDGFLCDIELVVDDEILPAHRNILAASSDYFAAMFRTNMKEKYSDKVTLKAVTLKAIQEILEYIYSGKIELCKDNVADVLQAASMLQITSLLEIIEKYLLENISSDNLMWLKIISSQFSLVSLQQKVDERICQNFGKFCRSKEFVDLSAEEIEKYLLSDRICIGSEDILFDALVTWTHHDLANRKQIFSKLFCALRLQLVSMEFLSNTIRKHSLVKEESRCRDLVEDAMHFYLQPELFQNQHQRPSTSQSRSPPHSHQKKKAKPEEEPSTSKMQPTNNLPKSNLVPDAIKDFVNPATLIPNADCSICISPLNEQSGFTVSDDNFCHVVELKQCKHKFHSHCANAAYHAHSKSFTCPLCNKIYGVKKGVQPPGQMHHSVIPQSLPGFTCQTISISYDIKSGIQGKEHPNPGQRYHAVGFPRVAFLPDNEQGRKVLKLLQVAWGRKLIFTVGRSITSQMDNCVTWNEIHHKTSMRSGTYGYPDSTYLSSVIAELKAHGVTEADI